MPFGKFNRVDIASLDYLCLVSMFRWWDTTGYFPGVPGKTNPSSTQSSSNDDPNDLISLYIELDDGQYPNTTDLSSLFEADLATFGDGPPDPGGDPPTPTSSPAPTPSAPNGRQCAGTDNTKFMARDDMNDKISQFCADAANQKTQDAHSGSTVRTYNSGTRYEVILSMDWPPGTDITANMENNCQKAMIDIMDGKFPSSPLQPLVCADFVYSRL